MLDSLSEDVDDNACPEMKVEREQLILYYYYYYIIRVAIQ